MGLRKGIRYNNRWFSFFDLLGFQRLVRDKNLEQVIPIYEAILAALKAKADPKQKIRWDRLCTRNCRYREKQTR